MTAQKRLFILLLTVLAFGLAACGGDDSEEPTETPPLARTYNIRLDVMPESLGGWTRVADSQILTTEADRLVLTATYQKDSDPTVTADVRATVYQEIEAAQTAFQDALTRYQSDPANTVTRITAFADDAYTVNGYQAGVFFSNIDGVGEVTMNGTAADYDLLHLMSITNFALESRDIPLAGWGTSVPTVLPPVIPTEEG